MEEPAPRSRDESLRLLEETHEFPCRFLIKVIGRAEDDLESRIVQAIDAHGSSEDSLSYRVRQTPNGRHISMTLEPQVDSAEEVLQIYDRIRQVSGVVMIL